MEYSNGWNSFKKKGLNFIHLNINSLLPKIEELCFIAKSTNAAVIGNCESKLDKKLVLIILKFCVVIQTDLVEQQLAI